MKLKKILFTAWLFFTIFGAYAQYYSPAPNQKPAFSSRWYPGGNIGLSISPNLFIGISPLAGYWVSSRLTVGMMATYAYHRIRLASVNNSKYNYQTHIFGLSPFGRYYVTKWLFAHVETGFMYGTSLRIKNISQNTYEIRGSQTKLHFYPNVGGGMQFGLGERSGFFFLVLLNLGYDPDILFYPNRPLDIRLGFMF